MAKRRYGALKAGEVAPGDRDALANAQALAKK